MSLFIPNSYLTPNAYNDYIMPLLTGDEWKIVTYALRRTFGFQKLTDRISLSQFARGIKNKEGEYLDYGTGLSVPTCSKCLAALTLYRVLVEVSPAEPKKSLPPEWSLQLDYDTVDWEGLRTRQQVKKAGNRARMQIARLSRPPVVGLQRVIITAAPPYNGIEGGSQTTPYNGIEGGDPLNTTIDPLAMPQGDPPTTPLKDKVTEENQGKTSNNGGTPPVVIEEKEDTSPLKPSTEGGYLLFNLLGDNAAAKGHRRPKRFPTLETKAKFEAAEERLGEKLETAIVTALEQGLPSLVSIVNYVAKFSGEPLPINSTNKPQQRAGQPAGFAAATPPKNNANSRKAKAEALLAAAQPLAEGVPA